MLNGMQLFTQVQLSLRHSTQALPSGCNIRSTSPGLGPASRRLSTLVNNIQSRRLTVERCMTRYMLKKEARSIVEGVARGRGVVIRYEEEEGEKAEGGASEEVGRAETSDAAAGNFH